MSAFVPQFEVLALGWEFLLGQSVGGLVWLFWFTLVLELPRYGAGVLALAATAWRQPDEAARRNRGLAGAPVDDARSLAARTSVVVVGYNEGGAIERCVRSLREQSVSVFEIVVVSDGSGDDMAEVTTRLVREGLVDRVVVTDSRGGKAAGINLSVLTSRGAFILNVDCDCSFDRFAIEAILEPLRDPAVGAVVGDIAPRNGHRSLVASFQAIEYLFTISVGKRLADALDQVSCASGAFSVFRRSALDGVSGFDVGGGEDLDVTLRLRSAGWRIRFAPDALCYTDVPDGFGALVRQRRRWERDAVRLRFRKHSRLLAASEAFSWRAAIDQWDFLIFNVVVAVVFPMYLIWLLATYGMLGLAVLVAMQIGLLALDVVVLALAGVVTGRPVFWHHLPFLPGNGLFWGYAMRLVRLWAYIEEWTLYASTQDGYVPEKVRRIRKW